MNPYIALVAVVALIGAYFYGRHDGREIEVAKQAKAEEIVRQSREAMQRVAAEAIAQITIKHQTIRAEVQREVVEKPVYRDCRADDSILHSLNAAKGIEPTGSGELPGTSPSTDPTFGGIILDLLDTIAQYEKCRKAALAELK